MLRPKTWHNRTGELLRQIAPTMWVIERGYIFLKYIDVGGRTTIIRLPDGTLFVHAPLALTAPLKAAIDDIGRVTVVAAPNTEHVDFVAQWAHFYPDAVYLCPPGRIDKLSAIPFTRELSATNIPDPTLSDADIAQYFIPQAPFFNETIFLHRPTKTLLVTDFFWAYPSGPDVPRNTRAFGWGMNTLYKPVYDRLLVNDRPSFAALLERLLAENFCRIIPCHGDIIETDGHAKLRAFYQDALDTA